MKLDGQLFGLDWWVTAVFVAGIMNLVTAYVKPRLDRAFLRSSSWWRSRSAARLAARQRYLESLQEPDNLLHAYFVAVRHFLWAILYFTMSGVAVIITTLREREWPLEGVIVWAILVMVFTITAFQSLVASVSSNVAINAARRMKREASTASSSAPPTSPPPTSREVPEP